MPPAPFLFERGERLGNRRRPNRRRRRAARRTRRSWCGPRRRRRWPRSSADAALKGQVGLGFAPSMPTSTPAATRATCAASASHRLARSHRCRDRARSPRSSLEQHNKALAPNNLVPVYRSLAQVATRPGGQRAGARLLDICRAGGFRITGLRHVRRSGQTEASSNRETIDEEDGNAGIQGKTPHRFARGCAAT